MAVESPGFANQNSTYGAEQTRRAIASLLTRGATIGSIAGGVVSATDCQITPPGSGMSINISAGEVWCPGSSSSTQSGYYCRVSSSTNLSIATSNPTNPRIDRVSALITDSAYSGGTNTFAVAVETGTATAGATLSNLNGVAAAPASSYTLGYVLVPANATNIVGGDILNVSSLVTLGIPATTVVVQSTSITAAPGTIYDVSSGSVTITLPSSPVTGEWVTVVSGSAVSGASPTTVSGTGIYGLGLTNASSFLLGTPLSFATVTFNGTNWIVTGGQQDTGWIAFSSYTNSYSSSFGPATGGTVAGYRKVGSKVKLGGTLLNGTANTDATTLPAGYRPTYAANFSGLQAYNLDASLVQINTSGQMLIQYTGGSSTSLDGIEYTVD